MARAESHPARQEFPHSDLIVGRRKRLQGADESNPGELERTAASSDPKPSDRIPAGKPLDRQRRRQPFLLPGSPLLAKKILVRRGVRTHACRVETPLDAWLAAANPHESRVLP